ncbi:MAG: hypothetical protein EOS82_04860 [Mesorhizobium sp.]|uniref:hypothetical protein n=1 Tax=Mesorhizobium sp. TaxID=1871066 RepID=UPI000FE573B9|nr:hypothetical protein [Mesorhizobium sp.]RWD55012.1 MAG: hypothetical protein EOS75_18370 [Mesorhizobium sp.]RWQ55773.1 MAG: hypothetical protein EOS82_04860 [Mesorhizobium sp.]
MVLSKARVFIQRKDSPRSESRFSRTIWIDIWNAIDAIREIVTCLAGPFAESAFEGYLDPFDMAMNASDENEGSSDYADAKRIYGELRFLMPRRPDWGRIPHRGNFRTPLSGQHEQLDDGAERIADIARFGLTARPYSRQFGIVHHLACA